MKGSCKSLAELGYFFEEVCKATTDKLDWNNPEGQQYPHDIRKHLPLIPNSQGHRHLDWITIRRNDNKLYTFKEGDYKRLRLQDIKDMLLLLVQGKLTNFNVEDRLALNVSLRMFTRSIVIQRHVEDLQLAYPNPRGCIYQNKDKNNKLMRIDELYKFSDGTLNDVRTALDDILKRIRMKYLPQTENMRMSRGKLLVGDSLRGETFDCCKGPYDLSYDVLIITERFYTSAGNPVKEILLKLNLPDHRSILTDLKMEVKVPDSS
ncbi:hypothetical protein Tco_1484357 [Tanacetum coccineum]